LHTEGIEYVAGQLLHVSRIHVRQVQKSFLFQAPKCRVRYSSAE